MHYLRLDTKAKMEPLPFFVTVLETMTVNMPMRCCQANWHGSMRCIPEKGGSGNVNMWTLNSLTTSGCVRMPRRGQRDSIRHRSAFRIRPSPLLSRNSEKTCHMGAQAWAPKVFRCSLVTHPHWVTFMDNGRLPFLVFADYDVAPYGYFDFFDAVQMFCSNQVLGLGIGNVDRDYPLFAIPEMSAEFGLRFG